MTVKCEAGVTARILSFNLFGFEVQLLELGRFLVLVVFEPLDCGNGLAVHQVQNLDAVHECCVFRVQSLFLFIQLAFQVGFGRKGFLADGIGDEERIDVLLEHADFFLQVLFLLVYLGEGVAEGLGHFGLGGFLLLCPFSEFLQAFFFLLEGVGGAAAIECRAPDEALVLGAKRTDALFFGHVVVGELLFGIVAANPAKA